MADTSDNRQQVVDQPSPSSSTASGADPLASLHRMSTTAGLSSQEYVAINGAAIAATICGVASAFAMMSDLLLVIPGAAIVCTILAWRQISRSNGTQGGRGLAVLGLLLALGFGGLVVGRQVNEAVRLAPEKRAVAQVVEQFGQALVEGKWQAAYDMCSPGFRQDRVSLNRFTAQWDMLRRGVYGKINAAAWSGRTVFTLRGDTLTAGTMLVLECANSGSTRVGVQLVKVGGTWQVDLLPTIFTAPEEAPTEPGASPGTSPQ